MSNDMENLRTFADQLWKYMVPKINAKLSSNVSYFRAEVVSNPGNNKLEVQRPVENGTLTLPCVRAMSNAQPGQQVVALVMGSMSNAIIVGDGNLNVPGGSGDTGIANFQAQSDGSLVITLINGNTLTATPHDPTKQDVLTFDDVPTQGSNNPVKSGGIYTALAGKQDTLTFDDTPTANSSNPVKSSGIKSALDNKVDKVAGKGLSTNDFTNSLKDKLDGIEAGAEVNQNAFANVKVGSTTVAADAEQDTLELAAGNNITITPDATNDKVTIATTAEVNQNAFSNVAVGSVTVSADAKQDTLTLNAGGLVNLTGDATNDSVTIYVDPNHTHITTQVLDLVNADSYGPSGMVSFNADVAEVPLKNCVVNIEPLQAGSGTPSPTNVRAISGWTGANVTRAGKNLIQLTARSSTVNGVGFVPDQTTGTVHVTGAATSAYSIMPTMAQIRLGQGSYIISGCPSSGGANKYIIRDMQYTADNTFVRVVTDAGSGGTIAVTDETIIHKFDIVVYSGAGTVDVTFQPMLRLAAGTDATFEPFNGNVYDITFPTEAGTVYGGALDVLTGVLTADRALITLNGAESVNSFNNNTYGITLSGITMNPDGKISANQYPAAMTTTWNDMPDMTLWAFAYGSNSYVRVRNTNYANVDAFKASLVSNPLQIAYPLATTATYQLSPQIISTLLGSNSIWADCGTVSVDYGAFLSALDKAIEEHSDDDIRHTTEAEKTKLGGIEAGAQVNQNAFSNIKVGSTTVAADSKTDTLELVAGTNMTITPDATNDKITFAATFGSHTHDASDIVSGILPAARGGTGNGNGYIQIGQKSGTTLGSKATAEGNNTTASGNYGCHAEGSYTVASGNISHAEGSNTTASGDEAHAEGLGTVGSGKMSHAEGDHTTASGKCSHTEGGYTTASGDYSHVEGYNTIAAGLYQHVFGAYNVQDTTSIEIVGRGYPNARKNIRTLDENGNEWILGNLTQASDARLKDVQGSIPDLSSIRAIRFRWKNGDDKEHLGYLAQDVEEIAPYLVDVDSNGYKSLDYIALLTAKVEMLEQEIEKLKGDAQN